ncbi:hypothetical protein WG66_011752 [Moniliophthora roreri]|nr:hypothetical protein WG66_011752 [Moniliophthora roreri]
MKHWLPPSKEGFKPNSTSYPELDELSRYLSYFNRDDNISSIKLESTLYQQKDSTGAGEGRTNRRYQGDFSSVYNYPIMKTTVGI